MPEFKPWPKIHRLYRDILITEKIDGTNAAIGVTEEGAAYAQSRKRIITPEQDNFGFARFVADNGEVLAETLGPGVHFGEWYGLGIQRGYGLGEKRFALFNAPRWVSTLLPFPVTTVPIIYQGTFSEKVIREALANLRINGSRVNDEYPAEGIVVYHQDANTAFKITIEHDDKPKGQLEAEALAAAIPYA